MCSGEVRGDFSARLPECGRTGLGAPRVHPPRAGDMAPERVGDIGFVTSSYGSWPPPRPWPLPVVRAEEQLGPDQVTDAVFDVVAAQESVELAEQVDAILRG